MPENSNFPQYGAGSPRFGQEGFSQPQQGAEKGGSVLEKASGVASSVTETAREAMTTAARKAEDMASTVGNRVSSAVESGKEYMTERGLTGIGEDVTQFVRRNPLPSLLISFCLGFCIARAIKD
jgi:hypothetical protein